MIRTNHLLLLVIPPIHSDKNIIAVLLPGIPIIPVDPTTSLELRPREVRQVDIAPGLVLDPRSADPRNATATRQGPSRVESQISPDDLASQGLRP